MKGWGRIVVVAALAIPLAQGADAAGDLSAQTPIEVRVHLGQKGSKEHRFHPNELIFETGKLYRLILHNPSHIKHYFTSLGFAAKVFTRKIQVMNAPGGPEAKPIGEIKGAIREIEVYPEGTVEWWFVPVATGKLDDLHCHIKDPDGVSHADKGMVGEITIK